MTWQVLVFISVVTYSISVLLQRVLLKDEQTDPVAFSITFQLFTGVIIGLYTLLNGFKIPDLSPIILNMILMTVLYGAGNVFLFKALKLTEASEFTIIFASRVFWTVAGAVLILGESFSSRQFLGTLLMLTGIGLVSLRNSQLKLGKGSLFSLLAGASFGLAVVNDSFIIRNFDVPSYLTIAFILPAMAIWLLNPRPLGKISPKLGLLGIFYAVSAVTFFLAYQVGRNASQIAPLSQTSTILVVILAVIFLRERALLGRKILGAILSFLGVILLK